MGRLIIWRLSLMLIKPVEGRKIVPMYFPDNMNVQYFFFATYPGYFLQALPIALVAGIIYAVYKRKKQGVSLQETILSSLFVCYITGLLSLTLFNLVMSDIYYFLFYHMPSGSSYHWFTFEYDFIPDFYFDFSSENAGNILMFLPFGALYPLFRRNSTWIHTIRMGIGVSVGIELLQPIFGRSFDINDIILNGFGVIVSTGVFFLLKTVFHQKS